MIRRHRRHVVTSDSSDDDNTQSRNGTRSSVQTRKKQNATNDFHRIQHKREDQHHASSNNGLRGQKKRSIQSIIYSSSSDQEEILNPGRRGSLKALSDYDSGDSTDLAIRVRNHSVRNQRVKSQEATISGSSNKNIFSSGTGKRRKRGLADVSTSDTSDSGVPMCLRWKRKRIVSSSSEENDSDDLHNDLPKRRAETRRLTRQQTRNRNDHRPTANNRQQNRSKAERILTSHNSADEFSSDSDIRPRTSKHNLLPISSTDSSSLSSESDDSISSSSESDEMFAIQNPVRRGSRIALRESDDDTMWNVNTQSFEKVSKPKNTDQKSKLKKSVRYSDSDGESDKCPICLANFETQEIGSPSTCEHSFCLLCIQEWAKNHNTCPVDRQTFDSINVRTEVQGTIIREIPVTCPTHSLFSELNVWLQTLAVDLVDESSSDFESNGDEEIDELCCICFDDWLPISDMILCDGCNRAFHLNCLNPPLQYIPASNWFCSNCINN